MRALKQSVCYVILLIMHHKSDEHLNRQIKDLSNIKIPVSGRKIIVGSITYIVLAPLIIILTIRLDNALLLYLYLIPFLPVVGITYLIFTGKLKWVIKLLHKIYKVI